VVRYIILYPENYNILELPYITTCTVQGRSTAVRLEKAKYMNSRSPKCRICCCCYGIREWL